MNGQTERLRVILDLFELEGDVVEVVPHRAGHINDTFIARTRTKGGTRRYTLQRINASVFPRPDLIMHNIRIVSEAIRKKNEEAGEDPDSRGLTLVHAQGRPFHTDEDGSFWRCYHYVEGVTYNQISCDGTGILIAGEAAAAFRRFQDHLGGLDTRQLHVTIEDFHNTPVRFRRFEEAIALDSHGRTVDAAREIESARARETLCGVINEALERRSIPFRVAHNDTKINNVVFDDRQKGGPRALCVIDLDTVMPGSSLYDFGDLVRSCVCNRPEDETDLDAIGVNLDLFRALVKGFCGDRDGGRIIFTGEERELLVAASMVITFETGLRFLTDYLSGDVYFRVGRLRHNLDRARAQFRLLTDMEQKRDMMERIVTETA
jgi:hypothetical protein